MIASPVVESNHRTANTANTNEIVTLNVGGLRFQTRRSTLKRYPDTLLGSDELASYYEPELKEYFFDRNRTVFDPILGYYLSNGIMCLPSSINPDIFIEELRFFKMGPHVISKFEVQHVRRTNRNSYFHHDIQRKLWLWLDDPDSGFPAKFIAYFDLIIILVAVVAQCVESLPSIREQDGGKSTVRITLVVIETVSNIWFTVNFLARLICSPDKKQFCKSFLNWFDLLAILPFYLDKIFTKSKNLNFLMVLRFFRTLRIVRIFKMSRYFQGLFALGYALSSSAGELIIMALMLVIFVVLFSSLIFFTECCEGEPPDNTILTTTLANTGVASCLANFTLDGLQLTVNLVEMTKPIQLSVNMGNVTVAIPNVQEAQCSARYLATSSSYLATSVQQCSAHPLNKFDSIITGFWWSVITMSTVGYGDYAPQTALGKVVGGMCALTGILVISLPFPLIINRFNNFMKLHSCGNSQYSTIENGVPNDDGLPGIVPEYNGLAFGFYSKDNVARVTNRRASHSTGV